MSIIYGLEARHAWTPPGLTEALLTLNRLFEDDGDPVFPRYKLTEVGGLMGLGDVEANNDPKVGRAGETPRPGQRRGKSVAYVGLVQARSLRDLRVAEADLRAAFDDCSFEGRMDVSLHPDLPGFDEDEPAWYSARALGLDCGDSQGPPTVTTFGFERTFVVGLRMSDRRYFTVVGSSEVSVKETNEDVYFGGKPGGITLPAVAGRVTVTVQIPAFEGLAGILIRNEDSKKLVEVEIDGDLALTEITLDFDRRLVIGSDGNDYTGAITEAVLWLEEDPFPEGKNIIRYEVLGSGVTAFVSKAVLAWAEGHV